MLACHDKNALQVILVSGGTFDTFVSLLQKTAVSKIHTHWGVGGGGWYDLFSIKMRYRSS